MPNRDKIRFLMVGGFLGAGKTTALAALAQRLTVQSNRVALVTNDQAFDLVDTQILRQGGFTVGEVPGACFCCKFDDLLSTIEELDDREHPQVILAEPVGSCTDLVATVIEPMRQIYGQRFELGPFTVLLKPSHGMKILSGRPAGFSPQAAYIFEKQLEEADIIGINKVDRLSDDQRRDLRTLVADRFPKKRVLELSGRDGTGVEEWLELLSQERVETEEFIEVDYDTYAIGEAELGWLNCQLIVEGTVKFDLDTILVALAAKIADRLRDVDAETAHLKVLGEGGEASGLVNLVDSHHAPELSVASRASCERAHLVINARVATAPEILERELRAAGMQLADEHNLHLDWRSVQCFKPGRPVPTHRITGPA
jgi:Ni2+-binding GTPase involved in maturation of urease and hydrogenase